MSYPVDETIAAVASAQGGALRGVIRVSGPQVVAALAKCFCSDDRGDLAQLQHATVVSGMFAAGEPIGRIPCDLYVWPTARSYTGQPSAEIHTIGSPPILDAVMREVCRAGARPAEPGEFTMRAFLAGRLDLTQAEAVLGVIDARNEYELDIALTQLAGGLRAPLNQLRNDLLDLLAHLEAGLDFVEEDIEFISAADLQRQVNHSREQIENLVRQMTQRGQSSADYRVVLVGSPNVGKSSLLNALSAESTALVSEIAGTTRDYVSQRLDIDGVNCLFIDTAGVTPIGHPDQIARAAQAQTAEQQKQADLLLLCIDSTRPLNDWETEQLAETPVDETPAVDRLIVLTKCDAPRRTNLNGAAIDTSSTTGEGIPILRRRIVESATAASSSAIVAGTANRCRESLRRAAASLDAAIESSWRASGEELVAAEIRAALDELGNVVGAVYTDDILDRVFSRFCIGK